MSYTPSGVPVTFPGIETEDLMIPTFGPFAFTDDTHGPVVCSHLPTLDFIDIEDGKHQEDGILIQNTCDRIVT